MGKGFSLRTLATKLRPPSRGVRHMPRPRLASGMAGAGSFRLAVISAPAGSGKTAALSDWYLALRERRTAAWLSLDDFDNDPRRFLAHLIASVRTIRPRFGREALGILAANPDALMEDVATSLVRDFGRVKAGVTIFLDDYHEVRERSVHAAMDYLLRYVPPGVRFVVGTRRHPPLAAGRLRVRGELLEIGWEDLRFDVGETRTYLKDVCRLPLSEEQVLALCRRTEGWITGLQLAAMSLPEGLDAGRLAGTQRTIADYLLESVFGRQPAPVRHFLTRTAILDRMTAPLCDALTGRRDGRQVIETLEGGNLFIFGLDDRRAWYRYHHLFAEFLRGRLRAEHPEEVAGLYDRASEWFERNGSPTEAVRYAVAGGRFARAARLLESTGRDLFRQGDFQELRRWLDALPDAAVRRSPVLCALHGWALAYLGEFDSARRRIDGAEAAIARARRRPDRGPAPDAGPVEAELRVLRAVLGIIRTDEPDVSGLDPGIVSLFPPGEAALRSYAAITLGFAGRVEGDLAGALRHFQEALEMSDGADSSLVNLNARLNVGIALYHMGRMNDAERSFRRSLAVAGERTWLRSIGAAFLRYGLALVLHEKNRLEEALGELSEAIAFLTASDAFGFLGVALVERARTQLALGRADLAAADLARARQVAGSHGVVRVSFRADLLEARMAVRAGDAAGAAEHLKAARAVFGGENFGDRLVFPEKYEQFLVEQLRVLLAQRHFGAAVRLGGRALQSARSAGRGRNAVEFLVLQAAAWAGLSRMEKAQAMLEQALPRAEEEEIVRPFLDEERGIAPLLRRLETRKKRQAVVDVILAALPGRGRAADPKPAAAPAGEPFHRRELQILDLVSQGLRNREIGRRLALSEETVKWYLKRLFGKLYAGTRTEAIAKARALGLLG